jgi:hypothetical protein
MGNAFRHLARRLARTPYAIGLLAIGIIGIGAGVLSSYSTAQDNRDQLLLEMDRLINQMQGLRERITVLRPVQRPVLVRGFIAANVGGGKSERGANSPALEEIYLPNIEVVLRDPTTNTDSPPATTDLSGRFTTRVNGPGHYRVCWKGKGFGADCAAKSVSVGHSYSNIGTTVIPIPREPGYVALYGRVTLADGSTPRTLAPLANINAFATISILDANATALLETPVNNHDQYLFPLVPLAKQLAVRIREESYDRRQGLQLGNPSVPIQRIDLTIMNNPPRIDPLVALDHNKMRVSNAAPGDRVQLLARVSDRDNDQLGFLWQVSSGTLSSTTDPRPEWTLPNTQGNHSATLTVFDGKGGYAQSSLSLTIDRRGVVFSGLVFGTDTPLLAGAEVDVNGQAVLTDSRGYFRLHVPDRKRFVMTIRKTGYAFASNVYYDGVVGGSWRLTRADVFSADPTRSIELQNKRVPGDCPGAPSAHLTQEANRAFLIPRYQDGHGNAAPLPKDVQRQLPPPTARPSEQAGERDCGPGVTVKIPANSLVDANGNAPTGRVSVQLSTVDVATPDQMPGNYHRVLMPNGDVKVMPSYGAAVVEIFSGATKYNLRSGARATVVLPVDRSWRQRGGALRPTVPFLAYDESRGVWNEIGTAHLQIVGGYPAYVAEVAHFTAYGGSQTDGIFSSQLSCLAVQNVNMPESYALQITLPEPQPYYSNPQLTRLLVVKGGSSEFGLFDLPEHTNIVLIPAYGVDPDPNKAFRPMGVFVVNTGARMAQNWPTLPGTYEPAVLGSYYHETNGKPDGICSTKVVLTDLGQQFYPPTPAQGAFLHGLSSFAAVNLTDVDAAFPTDANQALRDAVAAASKDYRTQIDQRGLRTTLSCFKIANRMPIKAGETCPQHQVAGFTPQLPLIETTAVYANSADLGFGREMHCVKDGKKAACYVSNYDALVYTSPKAYWVADAAKALKAVDGFKGLIQPDATVAMEYSQLEAAAPNGSAITFVDNDLVVKFYVFDKDGNPVDDANLDGLGKRPVPQLCMVCHGGTIPNPSGIPSTGGGPISAPVATAVFSGPADVKLNAKFLPFDLRSFAFAASDDDAANPFSELNQQTKFRDLNQIVKAAPPPDPSDPSSKVISDLYDAWYPGNEQIKQIVVPLWNTPGLLHSTTYREVVARACRTCHVANPDPTLRFERPGGSPGVVGFVDKLGAIQLRVCKQHVMPHARRTHDLFWTDYPSPAGRLACGQEFTPGGGPLSPPTEFTPVATILSACVGCHNPSNALPTSAINYAGLDLTPSNAYSNIVGVPSTEFPSLKRVEFQAATEVNSYLWKKISNTHKNLGVYNPPGPGDPMPDLDLNSTGGASSGQGFLASNPQDAEKIRSWIQSGAPP